MTRIRAALVALALVAVSLLGMTAGAGSASATYAGRDGRIAFVRANQIYTMTSTGTGVTRLTSRGKSYRPHWSPDGRRIAYINETAGGVKDVWVMSATGRSKQQVTSTGDVTSAGAAWSPDGRTLAFARGSDPIYGSTLYTVRSTSPFGTPTQVISTRSTNELCAGDYGGGPVPVDRYVAWSAGNTIAVYNHDSACPDDAIWMYYPATGEYRQYAVTGGECCGFLDWSDLFFGPGSRFGYSQADHGDEYQVSNPPRRIVYSGFSSRDGDTGGSPSPSGTYMALTNASSGTARVLRARIDGTGRRVLTTGYQPDWQRIS